MNTVFEWHRIVKGAMANGSVVVSEPCLPHPVFRPGIHFLEETGRHIPNLIEWLLHARWPGAGGRNPHGHMAADRHPAGNRACCARIRGFISYVWSTPEA
ncbi:hypothetical protein RAA17_06200 [Komagataeibacter rhaeticus]|nr:hypothetical protein [Komagataeibacter rhaeticus]